MSSSSIQSLEQLYNEMNLQNSPKPVERAAYVEASMDPFTAPTPPPQPQEAVAPSNPFRMPQPLQPALPEVAAPKQESSNPTVQIQMYFDRMTKMMMTMDDRLSRLESLMSHNLYLLHQQQQQQLQQQQQAQQQQQQQPQQQPKKTQEEDLELALKEQVKTELEQLKKMQAQYEQDGEIARKIQEQMDSAYFNEEKKKFYTQPAAPFAQPQQSQRPRIPGMEECPLCQNQFKLNELEAHVYACLDGENNVNVEGKAKVVDKPGFLERLFGSKKQVPEDQIPLMGSPHPSGHAHAEYPGHPGAMYPMAYPAPMYPMPSSPYMHNAASQPPPQFYYYMPQHNQTA
jgi:hypothetical protein